MNMKTLIPLLLAVGLGLVTLVVAKTAMKPSAPQQGNTVGVVVAKRDVAIGRELSADDLSIARLPTEAAPGRYFRTVQEATGRAVTTTILKGQPVLETLLAPTGSGAGIAALIDKGLRAITIEVNETTGLAGMLNPGSKVDVLAAFRDTKTDQPITRTILQNVRVLAVGRNLTPGPGPDGQPQPPSGNITLLVTQKQAQALQLASQAGRPWLVLRNGLDVEEGNATGTTMAEIRGEGRPGLFSPSGWMTRMTDSLASQNAGGPTTRPSKDHNVWVMRVIRGGALSEVAFPIDPAAETPPAAAGPVVAEVVSVPNVAPEVKAEDPTANAPAPTIAPTTAPAVASLPTTQPSAHEGEITGTDNRETTPR